MSVFSHSDREVLRELDPNANLWRRRAVKRPPITMDQENEDAVRTGLSSGIYDRGEIIAMTNNSFFGPSAAVAGATQAALFRRLHEQEVDDDDESPIPDDVGFGAELENEMDPNDISPDDMDSDEPDQEDGEEDGDTDEPNDLQVGDQSPVAFFDPTVMGLKEINNLAHFGVSSHKPGNGVDELLSDDLDKYWQYVLPPCPRSQLGHGRPAHSVSTDLMANNHTS